jgi:phospholipid-binding lipoprotein MlaA
MQHILKWVVMLVGLCLLPYSTTWAESAEPPMALPANENADDTTLMDEPFDPFDDQKESVYGEKGDLLELVPDPFSGFNRAMFTFNDDIYFGILRPISVGYRFILPTPVRVSIHNFFFNLLMPVRFINCLLQGKIKAAGGELGRFTVNSTVGMIGFYTPAKIRPEWNPPEEDFGQTLGRYNVGNGFYIVWPLVGPSTLRDTVGTIGDWAVNPFAFMKLINVQAGELTSNATNVTMFGVRTVNNTSLRLGDYEMLKSAALDPYEAFRNAYIQNRNSMIAE